MKRARHLVMAAAFTGAMILSACGGGEEDPQTATPTETVPATEATSPPEASTEDADAGAFEELVSAAQAEGALTIYGSPTENVLQAVVDGFSDEYGIDAQFIRMNGTDLVQRFSSEAEANTFAADILLAADSSTDPAGGFFADSAGKGWVTPLEDLGIPGYPWDFPQEWVRDTRAVVQIQPWLFSYNTTLVSDPPLQWEDLTDERFRDLILLPDPASSVSYLHLWSVVHDAYGDEFFEALRAQNLRVFESGVPATEALGAGEGGLSVPSVGGLAIGARDRGAPVDITIPDVTTGVEMSLAVVDPEKSEHPNAAKLFAAYIMSPEGNAVFNDFEAVFSVYDEEGLPSRYASPPIMDEASTAQIFELLGVEQN